MAKSKKSTTTPLKQDAVALNHEITVLKSKLAMSNAAFLNIIGKSTDGIVIVDEMKMVVYTNYNAIRLFDRNIADLLGFPLNLNCNALDLIGSSEEITEITIPKADGNLVTAEVDVIPTLWNSNLCHVLRFRDITDRKEREQKLEYQATHDYLTNLPNRTCLEQQIEKAIYYANEFDMYIAILFLDLDNFKTINDGLGHDTGDLLLKEVSLLLQQAVRRGDTVARVGGDEFVIILNALRKPDSAANIAYSLLDKLGKPFILNGQEIIISASVGIEIYSREGVAKPSELIKNADEAMYIAKECGRNQYRFYSERFNHYNEQRLQLLNGLRHAIHNNELFLEYQPIIDLKQSICYGVEVLIRWNHPQLGLILPDQFLPLAEETNNMKSIGRWVIKQALKDYSEFPVDSLIFISINMSANEFVSAQMAETLLSNIETLNISPDKIILELTEKTIISQPKAFSKISNYLAKDIGVKFAIDDYGIGYSSLSVLKRLPISILKIDRSFINNIGSDNINTNIVTSTIQLAHNLGIKVVAEGVESKEQLLFLQDHGCDYIQGYYFSKPLNINKLKKYLQRKLDLT